MNPTPRMAEYAVKHPDAAGGELFARLADLVDEMNARHAQTGEELLHALSTVLVLAMPMIAEPANFGLDGTRADFRGLLGTTLVDLANKELAKKQRAKVPS